MIAAADLVLRYGSPLYVYRLERIGAAVRDLRAALPAHSTLYYSVKANPHPTVVREMNAHSCAFEISSVGELHAVRAAGASTGHCLYTGPGKTEAEIRDAITHGVRRFSVESAADLDRVGHVATEHYATVECLVRVNGSRIGPGGLGMASSQFGIDEERIADVAARCVTANVRIAGFHLFPLSNAADQRSLTEQLLRNAEIAARLRERVGFPVEQVNLGGGFAAPYARQGSRDEYRCLRGRLTDALDDLLPGWRRGEPRIGFESGRYLVADSGELACTVTEVKRSRGRTYVLTDSGTNQLGGMSGLGRLLPLAVEPDGADTGTEVVDLVGPLCTPLDVLGRDVRLPPVRPGDVLVIPNAGAYGLTASVVAFLSRPPAGEVCTRNAEVVTATRLTITHTTIEGDDEYCVDTGV